MSANFTCSFTRPEIKREIHQNPQDLECGVDHLGTNFFGFPIQKLAILQLSRFPIFPII